MNIKRLKILIQKKQERERHAYKNDQLEKNEQLLRDKYAHENIKIIDRKLLNRKENISTVLLEMIKPVLFTAQDEKDARGIVSMGIAAWNCGIIKQTMGEEKFRDAMKAFKGKENSEIHSSITFK